MISAAPARAARKASAAKGHHSAPSKAHHASGSKRAHKSKHILETPTSEMTPSSLPTTTETATPSFLKSVKPKRKATPVPIEIIKRLQKNMEIKHGKKYIQDELKNLLEEFWSVVIDELLDEKERRVPDKHDKERTIVKPPAHKLSLMNIMTLKLAFRHGQTFHPPTKKGQEPAAPEVKPPRWALSVTIKEDFKERLEAHFEHYHGEVIDAFHAARQNIKDDSYLKTVYKHKLLVSPAEKKARAALSMAPKSSSSKAAKKSSKKH